MVVMTGLLDSAEVLNRAYDLGASTWASRSLQRH